MGKKNINFLDKNVMYLSNCLRFKNGNEISIKDFYLLHISDVCYDEQAPKKEALENVLSSLKMEGINFVFLIVGRREKVDFYYGISKDLNYDKELSLEIKDIGDHILKPSIQGNFRGSRVHPPPSPLSCRCGRRGNASASHSRGAQGWGRSG